MTPDRREYGSGSVYQRSSDGRWIGSYDNGFHPNGKRRRSTVSGKTPHEVKRRLRNAISARDRGEEVASKITVKAWADQYLAIRVKELAPKAYRAAENPLRLWVVPTIGHRQLSQLNPGDIRAVHDACRQAGRQAGDVHRVLKTMLNTAVTEGHHVAPAVLKVKAPKDDQSDRAAMSIQEGVACLTIASTMPHGSRWAFTLHSGARMGECLGLTWDAIDWDRGFARIEWQLQALPYNTPRDRSSGFRTPPGYEARHLIDAYHLTRPKTQKGRRLAPLPPLVRKGLEHWREIAPDNPWGLVWPDARGRPRNDHEDRAEWKWLQEQACVAHPSGRPYHVHECRNFAATMLFRENVPAHIITDLLGHASIDTSEGYRSERIEELTEAMERVGKRLQLG